VKDVTVTADTYGIAVGDELSMTSGDPNIGSGPFRVVSITGTTLTMRRRPWWHRAWRWLRRMARR